MVNHLQYIADIFYNTYRYHISLITFYCSLIENKHFVTAIYIYIYIYFVCGCLMLQ